MLRTMVRSDATWIDCSPMPQGGVAVALATLTGLEVRHIDFWGDELVWKLAHRDPNDPESPPLTPGDMGFLRCAADQSGRVACIGQGQDGQAYLTRNGAALEALDATFGVFCVEVRGVVDGWEIGILRQGFFELIGVPFVGAITRRYMENTPTTQGFIQIDKPGANGPGGVVLSDDGRTAVPGLILAELAGSPWLNPIGRMAALEQTKRSRPRAIAAAYAAGQNADDGPDRIRLTDGERYAALLYEYAQPPHAVCGIDGSVWVAAWTNSGAWLAGYPNDAAIPWDNEQDRPIPPDPPDPPTVAEPKITIESYAPASGQAPLAVKAIAAIDPASGPIDELHWLYGAHGAEGAWLVDATNEPTDPDHTYHFNNPGQYEIALLAIGPGGSDQTGKPRIVTVEAKPEPPKPEPPAGIATGFVCHDGTHYLCADLGVSDDGGEVRVVADRLEQGAYETFEVINQPDGATVALKAHANNRFVHAHDGGGAGLYADRDQVGEHERFTLEPSGAGYAIKTSSGLYVCAENGGGSIVVADRGSAGVWETFVSTVPLRPENAGAWRTLNGRIVWTPYGLRDDAGPFVPVFYHHGDAPIWWAKDPGSVRAVMDAMQAHGQMGFRAWMGRLLPSYWDDYILNESAFAAFQAELKSRNLRLMWDGGDLGRASSEERSRVQRILLEVGDRDVLASVSMCNEGNDNADMEPSEMADWLEPIVAKWPDLPVWCTTCGAGQECTAHGKTIDPNYDEHYDCDRFNPAPAKLTGKHGYRSGSIVDKARHCFSFVYEGQPRSPWVVDDEPPGPGAFVSGMSNQHEMTPEGCATIFLTAAIAKNWWVYFPGLEKHTQPVEQFTAHADRIAKQAAQLPADLFAYDDLEHGGPSQARRVWEVTDTNGEETARCDHALKGSELYVCSNYDEPPRAHYRQIRGTETDRIENLPFGFVSMGRQ